MHTLHPGSSRVAIPGAVGAVAALIALISELGRLLIKGTGYPFESFNDIHFYFAMGQNLWGDPLPILKEISSLGLVVAPSELHDFYGGENAFWATHIHGENGLSHQPPWAYRILVPTTISLLNVFGLDWRSGALLVFVISAAMLATSSYLLIQMFAENWVWSALVSIGIVLAAVAATSPGYPDMSFLALGMLSVFFAYRQMAWSFAATGFAAGLVRETALLLVASWIALAWSNGRLTRKTSLAVMGPLCGVILARLLVEVPNPDVDYGSMLQPSDAWPLTIVLSLLPLASLGLVSPRVIYSIALNSESKLRTAEVALWVVGVAFVFGSSLMNLATTRMVLLSLPLLLAPGGWQLARSRLWAVAALAATLGYAVGETLTFRADPLFGQAPWIISLGVVVSMQILALKRDKKLRTCVPNAS